MKKVVIRNNLFVRISAALLIIGLWMFFSSSDLSYSKPADAIKTPQNDKIETATSANNDQRVAGAIMPSMPQQEAKVELGRASWKYFHTLLARFPDEPTKDEQEKLNTFLHLYAELYPCGECSYHFVKMLEKFPPQVSSRLTAAMWGCHVHNKVNEHLKKEIYDCSNILEDYDCGCGDESGKIQENLKLNDKVTLEKEGKQSG